MLILSRKPGETVVIDGRIRVKVIRVEGDVVKIGIDAPAEVSIHRQEVYDEIQRNNKEAATPDQPVAGSDVPPCSRGVAGAGRAPFVRATLARLIGSFDD